jgi:hypothetical protein
MVFRKLKTAKKISLITSGIFVSLTMLSAPVFAAELMGGPQLPGIVSGTGPCYDSGTCPVVCSPNGLTTNSVSPTNPQTQNYVTSTLACAQPAPPPAPAPAMPTIPMPNFGGGAPAQQQTQQQQVSNEWTGYRSDPPITNSPTSPPSTADAPKGEAKITALAEKCSQQVMTDIPAKLPTGTAGCGRRVGAMATCMGTGMGHPCDGNCGDGKSFVNCQGLTKCGYEQVQANDPKAQEKCTTPGTIRAYTATPTEAGSQFGHVEFVCGVGKYCSVYKSGALDRPWPRDKADGCWIPTAAVSSGSGS